MAFIPHRLFFEEEAFDYPMAKRIWELLHSNSKIAVQILKPKQRITNIPGDSPQEAYREGKRTLVVGVRKTLTFQTCKPSAHYQLPLVTGCMGQCEYCYLNTQFGKKPYIRVYVNIDEILNQAAMHIEQRKPATTIFEGAATSDPVPVEPYTGSLAKTIEFFARQTCGLFRFVTKYTDVDSLLNLEHEGKTTIRFSINAEQIIKAYEHFTPGLPGRLQAARNVAQAGYPLGFIIGPIILFDGWEENYQEMFKHLYGYLSGVNAENISFEIISHRYTSRAKKIINQVYPDTTLPMDEGLRKFKYGQFGYGKYIYPPEQMESISSFFSQKIGDLFPGARISYII
ncbi:MAG: spore photoproduct lyase [Syntrophomonas sp.]